jgi:hypothetical protein
MKKNTRKISYTPQTLMGKTTNFFREYGGLRSRNLVVLMGYLPKPQEKTTRFTNFFYQQLTLLLHAKNNYDCKRKGGRKCAIFLGRILEHELGSHTPH